LPPAGKGEHIPGVVEMLHARHMPSQALLQQTPSTQKPEAHSLAQEHLAPSCWRAAGASEQTSGPSERSELPPSAPPPRGFNPPTSVLHPGVARKGNARTGNDRKRTFAKMRFELDMKLPPGTALAVRQHT
jgi:hypothetical protein